MNKLNILPKVGWVGVGLDGTLATYTGWYGIEHIGPPVISVLNLVKEMLNEGVDVRIFTARCIEAEAIKYIEEWCEEYIGKILPITNTKDFEMICLYDDRAIPVKFNEGTYDIKV